MRFRGCEFGCGTGRGSSGSQRWIHMTDKTMDIEMNSRTSDHNVYPMVILCMNNHMRGGFKQEIRVLNRTVTHKVDFVASWDTTTSMTDLAQATIPNIFYRVLVARSGADWNVTTNRRRTRCVLGSTGLQFQHSSRIGTTLLLTLQSSSILSQECFGDVREYAEKETFSSKQGLPSSGWMRNTHPI